MTISSWFHPASASPLLNKKDALWQPLTWLRRVLYWLSTGLDEGYSLLTDSRALSAAGASSLVVDGKECVSCERRSNLFNNWIYDSISDRECKGLAFPQKNKMKAAFQEMVGDGYTLGITCDSE